MGVIAPWDLSTSQTQRGLFVPKGFPFITSHSVAQAWGEEWGRGTPLQLKWQ